MSNKQDIKALRQVLGLSQQELGKRVGVDRSTIHSWEKGLTEPKGKNDSKIQEVFDDTYNFYTHRKNAEEASYDFVAESLKAIQKNFKVGQCYTITENRIPAKSSILQQSILRYERKEGIHHVFMEVRGKWIVTYTDAQLIGKYIEEVSI